MTAKRERSVMYAGMALLALSVATVCVRWAAGGGPPVRQRQATARNGSPAPPRPLSGQRRPLLHVTSAPDNDLIVRRNLFRPLVEKRRIGESGNRPPSPSSLPPLSPSTLSAPPLPLPFRMAGVVDNGRSSVALVEETDSGRYHAVKAGEKVSDVEVVSVEATRVVVKQGGVLRELPLTQGEKQETTGSGQGAKDAPGVELERRVTPKN